MQPHVTRLVPCKLAPQGDRALKGRAMLSTPQAAWQSCSPKQRVPLTGCFTFMVRQRKLTCKPWCCEPALVGTNDRSHLRLGVDTNFIGSCLGPALVSFSRLCRSKLLIANCLGARLHEQQNIVHKGESAPQLTWKKIFAFPRPSRLFPASMPSGTASLQF